MRINWSGGQSPFSLIINTFDNGAQTGIVKVESNANSPFTYTPTSDLVGKKLQFDVNDNSGAKGQSGATPAVAPASGSGSSGNSAASSDSSSSSPSSSAAAQASSGSASSSASDKSSSSSSAGASSTSSSKSPAGALRVPAAVAGVVGLAAAALL